jgi:hypothetical protein
MCIGNEAVISFMVLLLSHNQLHINTMGEAWNHIIKECEIILFLNVL